MKLKCEDAFNFNLRRYTACMQPHAEHPMQLKITVYSTYTFNGRGLHSSTVQLNLSRFCHSQFDTTRVSHKVLTLS
jgi:hypothetical protein